jgi:hypothetical protein
MYMDGETTLCHAKWGVAGTSELHDALNNYKQRSVDRGGYNRGLVHDDPMDCCVFGHFYPIDVFCL